MAKVALSREVGLECLLLARSTSVLLREVAYIHCGTGIRMLCFALLCFGGVKCHSIDGYFTNCNSRDSQQM